MRVSSRNHDTLTQLGSLGTKSKAGKPSVNVMKTSIHRNRGQIRNSKLSANADKPNLTPSRAFLRQLAVIIQRLQSQESRRWAKLFFDA